MTCDAWGLGYVLTVVYGVVVFLGAVSAIVLGTSVLGEYFREWVYRWIWRRSR